MNFDSGFRQPTSVENQIIQRLLMPEFPGKLELVKQLAGCVVRKIDENGSLEIKLQHSCVPAPVTKRVPVEAEATDEDGVRVHVLLHVVNGFIREIEIYKDDGSAIKRLPNATDFDLLVLPP